MTGVVTTAPPDRAVRRRGGLWWHRDFRRLWMGQASSKLGSSVTSVAMPLVAVATLQASAFQVALLSAAAWLPWLLIGLPAGAWVDRLRRRPIMVVCDLTAALLFLSVPVAAWLDLLTIGHLLAVALLAGTADVFFRTAYQAYLPSLLDERDLPEGNAKLQGTESAVSVAGPGLAGLLAQFAGAVTAVLLDALSFVASALCLSSIGFREPRNPQPRRSANLRREIAEGIRFVARDRYLRVFTVAGAASNIGLTGYQSLIVVFLVREVGLRPGTVGILLTAMSCGGVLGAAVATPLARRFGTARTVLICNLGASPFGLLIPLTDRGPRLALLVIGGLVIGIGVVAGNVVKGVFRQRYTPPHLLGRVMVSMQFLNFGAIPLGALMAGSLAAALGVRPAIWIMTSGLALTGVILLAEPIRGRRDLPERPGG